MHRPFAARRAPLALPCLPLAAALLACAALSQEPETAAQKPKPWRLQNAIGNPSWLRLTGQVRLRWEGLDGQFRPQARLDDSDNLAFLRTLLRADLVFDPVELTIEGIDARHFGGSTGSFLNTSSVDGADILQAFGKVDLGALGSGEHRLLAGRETIDLGSRRLVARNRFRNTINAFSGVDWLWESEESSVRAFWTLPVLRLPADLDSVVDVDLELDDEDLDFQFFGGFFSHELQPDVVLELYAYFLYDDRTSASRRLVTPGFRVVRAASRGEIDYEVEAAYQLGDARSTAAGPDLDHSAWFEHASVGYTFDAAWEPRLGAAFDYASGDRDPNDGDDERFDTLFGARRFEYGPTGIYGAIARGNLMSPELRLTLKPCPDTHILLAGRGIWLASARDAWVGTGVVDPTGRAGRHVGEQIEGAWRWDVVPQSVRLEIGGAYLFAGRFQDDAPNGQGTDTAYGYAQVSWTF